MNTDPVATESPDGPSCGAPAPPPPALRAVHTPNFPALLQRLGASLLVTTYQAGKLVMVRDEGDHLEHSLPRLPGRLMGLAFQGDRLAIMHFRAGVGICRCSGSDGQARAARPPRRLLLASLIPHHRQCANPRDGLGGWR